jgi:hypothetical protein
LKFLAVAPHICRRLRSNSTSTVSQRLSLSPLLTSLVFYGAPPRPVPLDFSQGIEQAADGQSSPAHGSFSSRLPSTYLEAPENLSKPIAFTASARTSSNSPSPPGTSTTSPPSTPVPQPRRTCLPGELPPPLNFSPLDLNRKAQIDH